MKKLVSVLILLAANNTYSFSGNSLNEWLESEDLRPRATAFIYGVAMGYIEGQSFSNFSAGKICFPEGVTADQMTSMVAKHLRDNPSVTHQSASFLTAMVLLGAFSCEKRSQ